MDIVSPMLGDAQAMPPTIQGFKSLDQGPSDSDYEQVFVVSYVWRLPRLSGMNRWVRGIAGGWELSGITSAHSGGPLTIMAGRDQSQTGIGYDRGTLLSSVVYGSGACQNRAPCVDSVVPATFGLPALGTFRKYREGANSLLVLRPADSPRLPADR
jgi:hypothetical protein